MGGGACNVLCPTDVRKLTIVAGGEQIVPMVLAALVPIAEITLPKLNICSIFDRVLILSKSIVAEIR